MGLTVSTPTSNSEAINAGNVRVAVRDFVFDSTYPTGGEAVSAADFGMQQIIASTAQVKVAGTGSVTAVHHDITNGKLVAYTAAAEVGNNVDISAVTARVVAFGK